MASLKTHEAHELEDLQQLEEKIHATERREKIHHAIMIGLGVLLATSVAFHVCPLRKRLMECKKCK